jgi:hypothetical protein
MLGDPFLDFELTLVGTVDGVLQGRTLFGRDVDFDVLAGERRGDEAGR